MSLINQMLKDLEARRQQDNPAVHKVTVAPCYQSSQRHTALVLLVVLGLLFGGGMGVWWYITQHEQLASSAVEQGVAALNAVAATSQPAGIPTNKPAPLTPPASSALAQQLAVQSARASQNTVVEAAVAPPEVVPARAVAGAGSISAGDSQQHKARALGVLPTAAVAPKPQMSKSAAKVQVSPAVAVAEQAQRLRVQAQRLLAQHQYAAAVKLLQQANAMAGVTAAQWHQLIVTQLQARQLAAACQSADRGCQQYPHAVALRVLQARLLLETGNRQQALAALKLIVPPPAVTAASEYYAMLATVQQQGGDFVAAQKSYAQLTQAFAQRGKWWIGRAICAEQLRQRAAAMDYFHQALGCAQLSPQLKQYAMQQLQRLGKG